MPCQTFQAFLQVISSIRSSICTRYLQIIERKNTDSFHLREVVTKFIEWKLQQTWQKTWIDYCHYLDYLMKHRVMSWINGISTVNISRHKKLSISSSQQLCLMSTCMTSQNSLRINVVCIIITAAYMIFWN